MDLNLDIECKKGEETKMKKSIVCAIVIMVMFGFGLIPVYGQETHPKFLTLPFNKQNVEVKNGWYYELNQMPHRGIDYILNEEDVVAAADGVVEDFLDNQPNTYPDGKYYWGNFIKIDHGNGFKTIYGHLKTGEIKVQKGDSVVAGQLIATSGNTGYSSGPHLHFEVWGPSTGGELANGAYKYDPYGLYHTDGDITPYNNNEMDEAKRLWTSNPPVHGTGLPLTITSFWSSTEENPPGPWVKGIGNNFKVTYRAKNSSDTDITVKGFRLEIHNLDGTIQKKFVEDLEERILIADPDAQDNTHKIDEANIPVSTLVSIFGTEITLRVVAKALFKPEKRSLDWYEIGSRSLRLPEFSVELFTPNRKDSDETWWFSRKDTVEVSFTIQNNRATPVTFDQLTIALHDFENNYLPNLDFKDPETGAVKIVKGETLASGGQYYFTPAELNLENVARGDYLIVVKYEEDNAWTNVETQHLKIDILTSQITSNGNPGPWFLSPANPTFHASFVVYNDSDTESAHIRELGIALQKPNGEDIGWFKNPATNTKYTEFIDIILEPGKEYPFPTQIDDEVFYNFSAKSPGLYRIAARALALDNEEFINIGSNFLTLTHFTGKFLDVGYGTGPWSVKAGAELEISFEIKNATEVAVDVSELKLEIINQKGQVLQPYSQIFNTSVSGTLTFLAQRIDTASLNPGIYQVIASVVYDPNGNEESKKIELIKQTITVTEGSTNPEPNPVESLPHETESTIQPKETHSWNLKLTAATSFKAEVSWPGSDLDLIITTPSGVTLTKSSPEVLDFYEGPINEYYVVKATETGDWSIAVYADDVAADGENYIFTITETLGLPYFSSADFASLKAAINAAYSKNGGIILVEPGVYRENIVLKNNVYLIATSPNLADTVIQGVKDNWDVVKCEAQNSAIVGFTIKGNKQKKGKGKGNQGNSAGINVIGGKLNPLIANCIILDNQHGIRIQGNSSPLILNNTIVQSTQTGIITNGNAPAVVLNNIIVENGIGIHAQSKKAIKTLNYNNVWGNSANYVGIQAGANSLSANPSFTGFFRLKAGSPCKNAGRDYVNSNPINLGAHVELDWQQIYHIYR
jgi:parallel beta-helix repeat protein